jgi:hypothetical protein
MSVGVAISPDQVEAGWVPGAGRHQATASRDITIAFTNPAIRVVERPTT